MNTVSLQEKHKWSKPTHIEIENFYSFVSVKKNKPLFKNLP